MQWYAMIKRFYEAGYYTTDNVKVFVTAGKITSEQYQEITGVTYATA